MTEEADFIASLEKLSLAEVRISLTSNRYSGPHYNAAVKWLVQKEDQESKGREARLASIEERQLSISARQAASSERQEEILARQAASSDRQTLIMASMRNASWAAAIAAAAAVIATIASIIMQA